MTHLFRCGSLFCSRQFVWPDANEGLYVGSYGPFSVAVGAVGTTVNSGSDVPVFNVVQQGNTGVNSTDYVVVPVVKYTS